MLHVQRGLVHAAGLPCLALVRWCCILYVAIFLVVVWLTFSAFWECNTLTFGRISCIVHCVGLLLPLLLSICWLTAQPPQMSVLSMEFLLIGYFWGLIFVTFRVRSLVIWLLQLWRYWMLRLTLLRRGGLRVYQCVCLGLLLGILILCCDLMGHFSEARVPGWGSPWNIYMVVLLPHFLCLCPPWMHSVQKCVLPLWELFSSVFWHLHGLPLRVIIAMLLVFCLVNMPPQNPFCLMLRRFVLISCSLGMFAAYGFLGITIRFVILWHVQLPPLVPSRCGVCQVGNHYQMFGSNLVMHFLRSLYSAFIDLPYWPLSSMVYDLGC